MNETLQVDTADGLLRTQKVAAWLVVSNSTLVRWRQSLERRATADALGSSPGEWCSGSA